MAASNDHRLAAMVELRARGKLPPELEKQIPAVAMARLSPGMRARAQAMLEGRSLISAREKSTKWGQQLLETTNLIDPAYDEAAAASRFKTVKDFADVSPGKPGAMMAAAGTAIKHMKRLESLIPGVAGHQIPVIGKAVNATENTLADWSGAPGITRWNQTADTSASELTRYFRQAGGNEADIQRELHSFTPNASDEQKRAADRLAQQKVSRAGHEPAGDEADRRQRRGLRGRRRNYLSGSGHHAR